MRRYDEVDAMWVKICGNTNLEDAMHAAGAGADAVGFIFAESRRQVTAAQVAAITPHLPASVERVGVFSSGDAARIAAIALEAGLTAVQLHGGLDIGLLERLGTQLARKVQIIQTLHWTVGGGANAWSSAQGIAGELEQIAALGITDRVLIDSKVGTISGGTGVTYDWSAARTVYSAAPGGLKLIVAGGLRPDNVAAAIAGLKPSGVDVSSGVEVSPGRKDHALVERFIKNAHG